MAKNAVQLSAENCCASVGKPPKASDRLANLHNLNNGLVNQTKYLRRCAQKQAKGTFKNLPNLKIIGHAPTNRNPVIGCGDRSSVWLERFHGMRSGLKLLRFSSSRSEECLLRQLVERMGSRLLFSALPGCASNGTPLKMFHVYIIQSGINSKKFYTGFSEDVTERIKYHNKGKATYTKKHILWRLLFSASFMGKEKALAFERYLKSSSGIAFRNKRLI